MRLPRSHLFRFSVRAFATAIFLQKSFKKALGNMLYEREDQIAAVRICNSLAPASNVLTSKWSHCGVALYTSSELHPVPLFSFMASLLLTASALTAFLRNPLASSARFRPVDWKVTTLTPGTEAEVLGT
jgi:hypothetical protein